MRTLWLVLILLPAALLTTGCGKRQPLTPKDLEALRPLADLRESAFDHRRQLEREAREEEEPITRRAPSVAVQVPSSAMEYRFREVDSPMHRAELRAPTLGRNVPQFPVSMPSPTAVPAPATSNPPAPTVSEAPSIGPGPVGNIGGSSPFGG